MPPSRVLLVAAPLALLACGPSRLYTDADVGTMNKLADLMWAQAQAADPAFRLIGKAAMVDEDFALAIKAGERLKLTAPRLKGALSKGADYDAFADALGTHADELVTAATAKDSAKTGAALAATKDTCKGCHRKFR